MHSNIYGIDLGTSIVNSTNESTVSRGIWTNESGPLWSVVEDLLAVIEVVMFALQMDSQLLIMLVFSLILFLSAESQRISLCSF